MTVTVATASADAPTADVSDEEVLAWVKRFNEWTVAQDPDRRPVPSKQLTQDTDPDTVTGIDPFDPGLTTGARLSVIDCYEELVEADELAGAAALRRLDSWREQQYFATRFRQYVTAANSE